MSKFQRLFLWALVVICWANFLAIPVIGVAIGDSSRGKVVDGHFYLSREGTLVEVSEHTFHLIQLHWASVLLTLPLSAWLWKILRGSQKS
jgi:hypothetical protein